MTAPGIYDGIDEADYHADKTSLSVSGAKKLLPPSCPAKFFHERENGQPPRRTFDFGRAAHAEVLGVGAEVVVVDAENWQTRAAREARDEAYAAGKTPVLKAEKARIAEMAVALRRNSLAAALLDPERGKAEQSGYFVDEITGVLRRFRLDWMPDTDGGRLLVPDYKSCASAAPAAIGKSVANYGYHMQDAWYRDGLHALGIAEDIAFLFVFQEVNPPYLVTVVQLDYTATEVGRRRNDQALQTYQRCTEAGDWPGYTDDVELIHLPRWADYEDTAA